MEAARNNAKSAGVADIVTIEQRDIRKFTKPENPAIIITNPPYGERLTPPDILNIYHTLGERLKNAFQGGEAWVISYKEDCFDEIGLKPSIKIPLYNGSLDCELRKYQIFNGRLSEYRAAGGVVKTDEERSRMSEKKRFKQHRGDFNNRYADRDGREELDEDLPPEYAILRSRHRRFERNRILKDRAEGEERPARRFGERKDFRDSDRRSDNRRNGDRRFGSDRRFEGDRRQKSDRRFEGKRRFDGGRKPFPRRDDND